MAKFLGSLNLRLLVLCIAVAAVFGNVFAAMAQTPEPPPGISEMTEAGMGIITDLGVLPIVFVGAIVFIAVTLFRRFKRAAG